ncbi:MAG: hypothetical protein AABX12_00610 [Nanoarchaeota archaeon]
MTKEGLSPEQFKLIRSSVVLGRIIQEDLGQGLREFYIGGGTRSETLDKFCLESRYNTGHNVIRAAVYFALLGQKNKYWGECYVGLISDEAERKKIARNHRVEAGKRGGIMAKKIGRGIFGLTAERLKDLGHETHQKKIGLHGMTPKQRAEAALKGGRKVYAEGIGIHSLTAEERRINSRHGGLAGARKKGQVPWIDEEKRLACELKRDEYNSREIAQSLNGYYHKGEEVRTADSIRGVMYKSRKLEDKARSS